MISQNSLEFAKQLDAKDPISKYRNEFYYFEVIGKEAIYSKGNSFADMLNFVQILNQGILKKSTL